MEEGERDISISRTCGQGKGEKRKKGREGGEEVRRDHCRGSFPDTKKKKSLGIKRYPRSSLPCEEGGKKKKERKKGGKEGNWRVKKEPSLTRPLRKKREGKKNLQGGEPFILHTSKTILWSCKGREKNEGILYS